MTRDDIIRLAREAGFESNSLGMTYTSGWLPDLLERFAALVAEREREACAKVCDEYIGIGGICAAAIRARGEV